MREFKLDFDDAYRKYRPKIVGYLRRFVGEAEGEDLAQEVFIKAGRVKQRFSDEAGFRAWIYRVATNAAIDRVRRPDFKRQTGPGRVAEPAEGCAPQHGPAPIESPVERQAIRTEMARCVQDVIADLREPYRTVLVLSDMAELKNVEIAQTLGVTLETVKIRLHRARAQLKEDLEQECQFYRDERNELACDPGATPRRRLTPRRR